VRRIALLAALGIAALVIYLLAWPVPIDPVAWDPPADRGLSGPFAANDRLAAARSLDLGPHEGPEDLALGADGAVYATTQGGAVLRIDASGEVSVFARAGGRPLGIEATDDGALIVANAVLGLQHIAADGAVSVILAELGAEPLVYANDVAIAADGTLYVSQSSTKFVPGKYGGTYGASLLDIMEHGGHGRVIEYRPDTATARIVLDDLNYANGVAVSDDQQFLVVAETGAYRLLKHWLAGPAAGETAVLVDNLPGFPDNVNNGSGGRFWVGLVAPRSGLLDGLGDKPRLRKVVQRLPGVLRPEAEPSSHVIAIDAYGQVLEDLQDPAHRLTALTGVLETGDALYLSSLFGNAVGFLAKEDLEPSARQ
jgi:sugar lactone lactonase YvrE